MRLALVTLVVISALTATPFPARAKNPSNPYPNEMPGLKLYVKYLAPLRPYESDPTLVVHVLGSDQGIELRRWRITPLFVGEKNTVNGRAWAHDITGRLASLHIRPRRRVSMLGVKFPPVFTHSLGGVSEINVTSDVYSDHFGLEYWLYQEDSAMGRKGDLIEIVYGASEGTEQSVVGQAGGPS